MKKLIAATLFAGALTATAALAKDSIVISSGPNLVIGQFDPTAGYGVWGPDIFHCHLARPGKNNVLEFDLATKAEVSPDGLVYTYTIRDDAKFADGHDLTAEDVVFTFMKAKSKASSADLTTLKEAKALDRNTVQFTLTEPSSLFNYNIAFVGIVPAHAYTDSYGDYPVCSGAWRIVDFTKGQQLILEANPYYYGPKPKLKRVTLLSLSQDAALAAAQSGQLDFVYVESEAALTPVPGMSTMKVDTLTALAINLPVIPESGVNSRGEKYGHNVTCDPAIRKALNIGINRKLIVQQALNGMGAPAYSVGGNVPWGAGISFEDNKVEEAKKILEDAGWKDTDGDGIREKNGLKAEIVITGRSNDIDRYNTVLALAQNVKSLGIHIIAKSAPWAEARKARATPTCWAFGTTSPIDFYQYHHGSLMNVSTIFNPSSYQNAEVDALMNEAIASTDLEASMKLWRKAEEKCIQDIPFLYISRPQNVYLVKDGLQIPSLGKVPTRNQGNSIVDNMTEWSWKD